MPVLYPQQPHSPVPSLLAPRASVQSHNTGGGVPFEWGFGTFSFNIVAARAAAAARGVFVVDVGSSFKLLHASKAARVAAASRVAYAARLLFGPLLQVGLLAEAFHRNNHATLRLAAADSARRVRGLREPGS